MTLMPFAAHMTNSRENFMWGARWRDSMGHDFSETSVLKCEYSSLKNNKLNRGDLKPAFHVPVLCKAKVKKVPSVQQIHFFNDEFCKPV